MSSNKIGVLSHLVRHGPSSLTELANGEHHQDQRLLEPGLAELVAGGMVAAGGRVFPATDPGQAATSTWDRCAAELPATGAACACPLSPYYGTETASLAGREAGKSG